MYLKCKIASIRADKRMTQAILSDRAGITIGLISAYENNKRYPSIHTLWKLSDALNCLVDELYEEE